MTAPIKLTNAQLESVAQGLASLDGISTKDGFTPFKFDEDTTWQLALLGAAVNQAVAVLVMARKSLARQNEVAEAMKITPENAPKVAAFFESLEKTLALEAPLGTHQRIERAKLNIAKNGIPPSALAKLVPILE